MLSFYPKLPELITFNISIEELCEKIDSNLYEHPEWKKEALTYLNSFFKHMGTIQASDLDMGGRGVKKKIWFRVNGRKRPSAEFPEIENIEITAIILSALNKSQKKSLYKEKSIDFTLNIQLESDQKFSRFRGNAYIEQNELAVNFRRINNFILSMEELNFPEKIIKRLDIQYEKFGLSLITGITGSGKSTTLDAIINMNNINNESHIIILGHPIEYLHDSERSLVRHRDVGPDVLSFRKGAIESLRQDPDIIVLGEIRDAATIATLLEITDSGHKTFSTLHTSSAIDSIHRIIAEFPPIEQERIRKRLGETLSIIISQKLVPSLDKKLVLAKEILSVTPSVRAAIINQNIAEIYQMINEGSSEGMITMEKDLANLFVKGIISYETAINYSNNKKRMNQILTYL